MSITTIYDFENPLDYTLSNISISNEIASLSLVAYPGQIFSQDLSSSSGFTFNSSSTSITGGVLSQISYFINPTLGSLVNATASAGSLTSTGSNATGYSTQSLSGNGYVGFTANTLTGTKVVGLSTTNPNGNYTGINFAFDQNLTQLLVLEFGAIVFSGTCATGDLLEVKVSGTTVTYYQNSNLIYTSLVAATFPLGLGAYIASSGMSISGLVFQTGDTRYQSDIITFPTFTYSGLGAIVGFSGFSTGGDINSPGYIINNRYWNGTAWVTSNGTYAQSNPQATVSAHILTLPNSNTITIRVITTSSNTQMSTTGPVVLTYSGQIYPVNGGTIQSNSSFSAQEILTFTSQFSETGSDTVTFALNMNGQLMYWTGTAWANSNGTFAQTNTASVINTHAPTLLSVNSNIEVFALLVSATGSTTPNITSMTVQYTFGSIEPTAPFTTIVFGFLRDIQSNPVSGATITFSLVNLIPNAYMEASSHVLMYSSVSVTTDSNGYFQAPIIATTQFGGINTFIQVVIQKDTAIENVGPNGQPLYLTIPVQESIDITSILSA